MNNSHIIELFDDYLMERMNSWERLDFEGKIENDEVLRAEFEKYKLLVKGVKDAAMKEKLKRFDEEMQEPNLGFVKKSGNLGIAAVALALIIVGYLVFKERPSSENLFAENFEPLPNELIQFTRGDSIPLEYQQLTIKEYRSLYLGMKAYQKKNFEKADSLMAAISEQTRIPEIALYLGIAQLSISKDTEAKGNLEVAAESMKENVKEHALWYLALYYLKIDDNKKAIEYLKLLEYSEVYDSMVEKILRSIDD